MKIILVVLLFLKLYKLNRLLLKYFPVIIKFTINAITYKLYTISIVYFTSFGVNSMMIELNRRITTRSTKYKKEVALIYLMQKYIETKNSISKRSDFPILFFFKILSIFLIKLIIAIPPYRNKNYFQIYIII